MNELNNTDIGREIGWDDEITADSQEFTLLPAGDYDFEVVAFERARHAGSAKLPQCNKAVLSLKFKGEEGETVINHNLFLHTKTEGMVSAFLICIGQKKHGEPTKPNWNTMVGSTGRAKLIVENWTGKDGEEHQSNRIKKFYEPKPTFTPGAF